MEDFEELEQKTIVYELDNSNLTRLRRKMETQAREGWFVHEVVTQEHLRGRDYLVVYRKD